MKKSILFFPANERRTSRRAFSILAMVWLLAGMLAADPVPALAGGTETIILVTSTPSWGPSTPVCPDGLVTGSFTSQDGSLGRIRSCVQSTDYSRDGNSWVEHTDLTLVLSTGQIEITAAIAVSSSTDGEYQTLKVKGTGTVSGGTGHFAGRTGTFSDVGTFIVGPDGVTGSVTFTITLR